LILKAIPFKFSCNFTFGISRIEEVPRLAPFANVFLTIVLTFIDLLCYWVAPSFFEEEIFFTLGTFIPSCGSVQIEVQAICHIIRGHTVFVGIENWSFFGA
jgi:hypothetical protein